jgi:hypothetical protein
VATIEDSNTVIRRADDRQTDNCLHASILPVHFTIKPRQMPRQAKATDASMAMLGGFQENSILHERVKTSVVVYR